MTSPTGTSPKKDDSPGGCALAFGAVVVIALLISIGKCSPGSGSNSSSLVSYNQSADDLGNAVSAQKSPPEQPLSFASIKRGVGHYRLVFGAEGLSGAMIYSQNCYDALAREFSWQKLDQCGAADMMAVRTLADDDGTSPEKETSYFADETAAGRYISAATGAGEEPGEVDTRLSALQTRVAKIAAKAAPKAVEGDGSEQSVGDVMSNLDSAPSGGE